MQRLQQLRFSSMRDAIGGIQEERTKDAASAILSSVVCVCLTVKVQAAGAMLHALQSVEASEECRRLQHSVTHCHASTLVSDCCLESTVPVQSPMSGTKIGWPLVTKGIHGKTYHVRTAGCWHIKANDC